MWKMSGCIYDGWKDMEIGILSLSFSVHQCLSSPVYLNMSGTLLLFLCECILSLHMKLIFMCFFVLVRLYCTFVMFGLISYTS